MPITNGFLFALLVLVSKEETFFLIMVLNTFCFILEKDYRFHLEMPFGGVFLIRSLRLCFLTWKVCSNCFTLNIFPAIKKSSFFSNKLQLALCEKDTFSISQLSYIPQKLSFHKTREQHLLALHILWQAYLSALILTKRRVMPDRQCQNRFKQSKV